MSCLRFFVYSLFRRSAFDETAVGPRTHVVQGASCRGSTVFKVAGNKSAPQVAFVPSKAPSV